MRRATNGHETTPYRVAISIHALLAESDRTFASLFCGCSDFYPRSPCGERRKPRRLKSRRCVFLSTLSLRRATPGTSVFRGWTLFLSTLSLRRATVNGDAPSSCIGNFYPRSPCGERRGISVTIREPAQFLSTLSLRRATTALYNILKLFTISIHALLAESDEQSASYNAYLEISIHALLAESDF